MIAPAGTEGPTAVTRPTVAVDGGPAGPSTVPAASRNTTWRLERTQPGQYGWSIYDPATDKLLHLDGVQACALTRWEARQILGWYGLTYTEAAA